MDNRRQLTLALDTTGHTGSIALRGESGLLYAASFGVRITHSETLMPEVDNALRFCGLMPADITGVLLCNGPGSFTGLRIGLATAKGIAFGLKVPLYAYNSLELTAMYRYRCGKNILCVLDAKMQEVYAALYDECLNPIVAPTVCRLETVLQWSHGNAYILGSAAHLVDLYDCNPVCGMALEAVNAAAALFALHDIRNQRNEYDFADLAALEPFYLRESTAQIRQRQPKL